MYKDKKSNGNFLRCNSHKKVSRPVSQTVSTLHYVWLDSQDWDDSHKSLFFELYKPHPVHRSIFQEDLKVFNALLCDFTNPCQAYGWTRGVIQKSIYASLELQICVNPHFERSLEAVSFFLSAAIASSSADRIRLSTNVLFENLPQQTVHLFSEENSTQMAWYEMTPQEWRQTPAGAETSKSVAYLQRRSDRL